MSGNADPRIPAPDILHAWQRELFAGPVVYVLNELEQAGYPRKRAYELVGDHLQRLGIGMATLADTKVCKNVERVTG